MGFERVRSGFEHGIGIFFARDFYYKVKEYAPIIILFIVCFAAPIAISLYFFRKLNDISSSMEQNRSSKIILSVKTNRSIRNSSNGCAGFLCTLRRNSCIRHHELNNCLFKL